MITKSHDIIWIIIVRDRVSEEANVYFEGFRTRVEATNVARQIEAEDELILVSLRQVIVPKQIENPKFSTN